MYNEFQEKASSFFDAVFKKHSGSMKCDKGCSDCCKVELSVFSWEAHLIETWFKNLNDEKKAELKRLWNSSQSSSNCVFLADHQCTIYERRPVICRTQGLPLLISENQFSCCPHNFPDDDNPPPKQDWLHLERLNTMSAILQKEFDKTDQTSDESETRIDLKKLQLKLINL